MTQEERNKRVSSRAYNNASRSAAEQAAASQSRQASDRKKADKKREYDKSKQNNSVGYQNMMARRKAAEEKNKQNNRSYLPSEAAEGPRRLSEIKTYDPSTAKLSPAQRAQKEYQDRKKAEEIRKKYDQGLKARG
jgi:hypothetical protein